MDARKSIVASRRGFICILSGLLSGLLFVSPDRVQAKKTKIKNLVANLEREILERSTPRRHPSITWNSYGSTTKLYMKTKGETRPVCTLNHAGKTVWDACDGENTPRGISRLVHQKYQVSSHQAHVDCLAFLARLKRVGAIQL